MTSNARHTESARVAVFAKAPVAGEVKTRLAPVLGPAAAASLQAGLVRHALALANGSGVGPVELWCAPDASHDFFARCEREFHVPLKEQRGADLGERMHNAVAEALQEGWPVVIIGADCPAMTVAHLRLAGQGLSTHDVVIAPAEDGGYVLIGLSKMVPEIFEGVDWGAAAVMTQTRARLQAASANWVELPTLWDVDRPEDYARLLREGLLSEVLS
jgi:rSAM/selenodomain-associated transferase 1